MSKWNISEYKGRFHCYRVKGHKVEYSSWYYKRFKSRDMACQWIKAVNLGIIPFVIHADYIERAIFHDDNTVTMAGFTVLSTGVVDVTKIKEENKCKS